MKRFLISVAFALVATAAFAQAGDRDVLVTPEGTVYTLETQIPSSSTSIEATSVLGLAIQNGKDMQRLIVPDSVSAGWHLGGALAYDADSKTLFVLWIHAPNWMSSELLLSSYHGGKWQRAVSIDNRDYHLRSNLRVGITRHVSQLQKDGTYADVPALLLHAVWWDQGQGTSEEARYAMLPVENGGVSPSAIEVHSLEEFVPSDDIYNSVDPNFNAEILRHPAIVSSPLQSNVDVVFGDTKQNSIHTISLHPIAEHRIHIPVGIGGGGTGGIKPQNIAAPSTFNSDWTGPITILERGGRLVFTNAGDKALSYITWSNGTWSDVKSIGIDYRFPAEAAIAAIDKMVSTQ